MTFTGARHVFTLDGAFEGGRVLNFLNFQFQIPGHLVADVTCAQEDGGTRIEVLTVETGEC